jgi:ferredoxin-type protein NapF
MAITRSRREFLLGRAGRAAPASARARMTEACLDRQGIVCQACRDTCAPGAIRFLPLAGGASTPIVDDARCTGCRECLAVCPANAITFEANAA